MHVQQKIFLLLPVTLLSASIFAKEKLMAEPTYHISSKSIYTFPTGITPAQIKHAYGIDNIANQGDGQTIAILAAYDHPNIEADLAVFNTTFGLPECTTDNGCFSKIYARDGIPEVKPQWAVEIALDVEWAHAIAPKAKIMLVEAADSSFDELSHAARVAAKKGADVVSMSWGAPEFSNESDYNRSFNVRHITYVAAAGDKSFSRLYPAASPYVLSVGGTKLKMDNGGNYISEKGWHKSNGGLSRYQKQLNYQRRFPIPHNKYDRRGVPDVAYHADEDTGFAVYNSVAYKNQSGWLVMGGTSAGAPQWAGIIAIANEIVGEGLTINSVLYRIGKSASYNVNFNDITKGSTGDCGYHCHSHHGYDYVTGLGTPKMPTLVRTVYQYYQSRQPK